MAQEPKEISSMAPSFESIKHTTDKGTEFWFGRELAPLLGYTQWRNFESVVLKAVTSADKAGAPVDNHFANVSKMVPLGSGSERQIDDFALSRYACYLIAQNSDPRKSEVAKAQTYFATQTRKQEVAEQESQDVKRIIARQKLSETEKKFSGVLSNRGVDGRGIAEIRSVGDQTLFGGYTTSQMKDKYGIKSTKPLADFLPTVTLKAKDLATEMSSVNIATRDIEGKVDIKREHVKNNSSVRRALLDRGIHVESLPAEEDIAKVKRRIKSKDNDLLT